MDINASINTTDVTRDRAYRQCDRQDHVTEEDHAAEIRNRRPRLEAATLRPLPQRIAPDRQENPGMRRLDMTTHQSKSAFDKRPASRAGAAPASRGASPQANYERYLALAKAKALAGDRIEAERYYQHAEHYLRLISGTAA
jgi:hypothetical protein